MTGTDSLMDDRHLELVLRNVEIARDRATEAIRSGEAPVDVLNRTLDFVRGFIDGTSGLIVPPDMIDPADLDEAVALGRKLAERFDWSEGTRHDATAWEEEA